MQDVCRGDRDAFAQLVTRHIDLVHHFALRAGNNPADADELAQESFLRVWQRAAEFDDRRGQFTTWLLGIVRHLSIDRYRTRQRRPQGHRASPSDLDAALNGQANGHSATEATLDDLPAPENDPGLALDRTRALTQLRRSIAGLPETQRTALTLCQLQRRSNAEAAAVLGVSVRAVESLLARARRALKREMGRTADNPTPAVATITEVQK